MTKSDGGTVSLEGDGKRSDIVFIKATPDPDDGTPIRYFAVMDDRLGDVSLTSLKTKGIDYKPAGNDVIITVTGNNKTRVTCFVAGTLIEVANGYSSIETIKAGDLVNTIDHGLQPVVWTGARTLSSLELARNPALRPIRIAAGALGHGVPNADLLVSPQHRVLLRSEMARSVFGAEEVLVAAKQLLSVDGIAIADDLQEVTYHHMLFREHEIVHSNGAETESFYTGPEALKGVGASAREEILTLFPQLEDGQFLPKAARMFAPNRMARELARCHGENNLPLVR